MAVRRYRRNLDYSRLRKIKLFTKLSNLILVGVGVFVVLVIGVVIYFATQIPSSDQLENKNLASSTKIFDRNGVLLYDIFKNQNRTPVTLADIPKNAQEATISIEDKNFYSEGGFSIVGILRAAIDLVTHHQIEGGGSTITQQLVKNSLLSNEQTFTRKLKELILAIQVDHAYTK